ncbi:MAG: DUF1330 domain-containing protein [Rhodocyclaceae bacterium]|nr:DUF1330 domain-containing protein [Rhodocyclaceae bacterium]
MTDTEVGTDVPAYLIARVSIKDGDVNRYMTEYGMPVIPIVAKYQGEVLVASSTAAVVEGDACYNWTVVLRFPSRRLADAWYFSDEYAPFRKYRMTTLTTGGDVVLVDGFDPGTPPG